MPCTLCRLGTTRPGATTVALFRGEVTVVIKDVPADICDNCGEYYLGEDVTEHVPSLEEQSVRAGAEVEIRRYGAGAGTGAQHTHR